MRIKCQPFALVLEVMVLLAVPRFPRWTSVLSLRRLKIALALACQSPPILALASHPPTPQILADSTAHLVVLFLKNLSVPSIDHGNNFDVR